jgi:hypothetical protein
LFWEYLVHGHFDCLIVLQDRNQVWRFHSRQMDRWQPNQKFDIYNQNS